MCDFKPWDEVVCLESCVTPPILLKAGEVYTVSRIEIVDDPEDSVRVFLHGVTEGCIWDGTFYGFPPSRFRKVQRRNLTEWLSQKTKFEEPKRVGENA